MPLDEQKLKFEIIKRVLLVTSCVSKDLKIWTLLIKNN
jgi:hypothetical protein